MPTPVTVEFIGKDGVTHVMHRMRDESGKFVAGMNSAGNSVGSTFLKIPGLADIATGALRRIGEVGINLAGQGLQALVGGMQDSITVAGDFEASLNIFKSVAGDALGAAGLEVSDLSALFLDMGAKTQFSAGQAAQAAIELVKGGIDPATIAAGALEQALGLAAAGGLELDSAANIMAKQLGVWGDTGVTASQVADLLAQAANASTVDVEDLALGLAQAGGVSKAAGVEFDDLVQTMALISPAFSSASDAGTSLKQFMLQLIPATDKAKEAAFELGLAYEDGKSKFFDAEGSFIGMSAAAELLSKQTSHLSEEARLAAFEVIFGSDAFRAAGELARAGAAGFAEMGAAMGAAGTAAEQSAQRNQGFKFAMDSLLGSVETLQIVIGGALLPVISELINNGLIPAVNNVMAFAQEILAAPDPIAALGTALMAMVPPDMAAMIIGINAALVEFVAFITPIAAQVAAVISQFVGWQEVMAAVAVVVAAIVIPAIASVVVAFGPVLLIIAAVMATVALLRYAWENNLGGIQEITAAVMTAIQTVIQTALGAIKVFWDTWGDEISGIVKFYTDQVKITFGAFTKLFEGDWKGFGEDLRVGWDAAWLAISLIVTNAIAEFLKIDWASIGTSILTGIANGIIAATQGLIDAAVAAARAAVEAVQGFLGIQSPSKVFAKIGEQTMAGMAQGILGNVTEPVKAGEQATRALTTAVTNNGGNTYNYYGVAADMNYEYNRAVAGAF